MRIRLRLVAQKQRRERTLRELRRRWIGWWAACVESRKLESKEHPFVTVGRKFGGANFFLSCLLNFRDDAARPWERARRVAGGTLKEVGEAADRALAS